MQLIGLEGDRYRLCFCPFPSKETRNGFLGGDTFADCVRWFVLLRDEPGKRFCAFQEESKENVHIYSNIIV